MDYLTKNHIGSFERISNLPAFDVKSGRYRRPNRHSKKGVCDIIGCIRGRFIGIEVKTKSEFMFVESFYKRIANRIFNYVPTTDKEKHVLGQIQYIVDKNKHGALCFFTYSLEHTIIKLGELAKCELNAPTQN